MKQKMTYAVVGLGATGLSVVRYLTSKGMTPCVVDTRLNPPGAQQLQKEHPNVPYTFGALTLESLKEATSIVVSPGVPISHPVLQQAKQQGASLIGDIELFAQDPIVKKAQVIGITGSNGKSTVTTLTGHILRDARFNTVIAGNIGVPVLSCIDPHVDIYVLELSSFQLETTLSLDCSIGVILNITDDHLDRYPSFAAYKEAKLSLYAQSQHVLMHQGDTMVHDARATSCIYYGLTPDAGNKWSVDKKNMTYKGQTICALDAFKFSGEHHSLNYMVSIAIAHHVGAPLETCIATACAFTGLEHRYQWVKEARGVCYINDSKATNVGATLAALESAGASSKRVILIAGGDAKGADLSPLTTALKSVSLLITLGQDGISLGRLAQNHQHVSSMREAVSIAVDYSQSGDTVLLSPACASIDMYQNFMARGDDFCQQVEALTCC